LPGRSRSLAFRVAPSVIVAERASTRTTVVEVNALDRPALLASLTGAIAGCGFQIHSAHIATYGERAVDVFYLTNREHRKLDAEEIERLRTALLRAAGEAEALAA
jgi:[protein-PII] uridylyltransferase